MSDRETLSVYAEAASEYAQKFARIDDIDMDQLSDLKAFFEGLPEGGLVLDLGCGPGQWAAKIRAAGYSVEAMDASPEMAKLAKDAFDLDVTVATFDDLKTEAHFDGIWANFSLLHAPRADFPAHLARIKRALKPAGKFHIGMKLGAEEGRDKLGRFYAYYGEDELSRLLKAAGFTVTRSRRGNGAGLAGGVETFVILTAHG